MHAGNSMRSRSEWRPPGDSPEPGAPPEYPGEPAESPPPAPPLEEPPPPDEVPPGPPPESRLWPPAPQGIGAA